MGVAYEGVTYSYQPRSKDFGYLASTPFLYLYLYMEVVGDHVAKKKGSKCSDPSYWDSVTMLIKDKENSLQSKNAAIFNSSLDFINQHFRRAIEKSSEDRASVHERIGDNAHIDILPGTNFKGGMTLLQRSREYVMVVLPPSTAHPQGSSYILMLRDDIEVTVNGKPVGRAPYNEEKVKEMCVKLQDFMSLAPDSVLNIELEDFIHAMWLLKPSGSKDFIATKLCNCCHMLAKFEYYDGTDREWGGLPTVDEFNAMLILIGKAWVSFLLMHEERGTKADYVKNFSSWLSQSYDQWKHLGRFEPMPDNSINLDNETAQTVRATLSDFMKMYAEEVACWTDESLVAVFTATMINL